jgi:hypothetical protein
MHTDTCRSTLRGILVASVSILILLYPNGARSRTKPDAAGQKRMKVADGEYVVTEKANGGAIGPFGEEIYNFHETWTLWHLANGQYEVSGERRFEAPIETGHANRFVVELSRDLTVIRVTEFAHLKWRRDSGPLTCDFLEIELHCSSHAVKPENAIQLTLPMQHPFGLLWPISAFSLSGLTRETERDPNHAAQVQLISIKQPSRDMPVEPTILDGELRFMGEENLDVAGHSERSLKFSIKVALSPELMIWTTPKGLLLAASVQPVSPAWPVTSMKLVQFHKFEDFK